MRLPPSLAAFIATRAGKAAAGGGLALVGLLVAVGVVLATGGGGGDGGTIPAADASPAGTPSPGPAATVTPATPSPSPAPSPSPTPSATATPSPGPSPSPSPPPQAGPPTTAAPRQTATQPAATPTLAATPAPAVEPVVAGGDYCPGSSPDILPTTLAGIITIGGEPAPPGTVVTLLFNGTAGPSGAVVVEDGRSGYSFRFSPGPAGCANRPGASLTVVIDGVGYSAGTWTAGEPFLLRNIAVP